MADIFQEVDEELRKDRYQVWLRKYGPWALGIAILVIALVGGWQFWESWSESRRDAASETYREAAVLVEDENWDDAETALAAIAESGPAGYATLALMQQGAIALQDGDNDMARRLFEQAAARSPDPLVAQLATLKAALAGFETYSADDLANRLGEIASGSSAMRYVAMELIATKAMEEGDYAAARSRYEGIVFALDAPEGVRARASAALAVLDRVAPDTATEAGDDTAAGDVPAETTEPAAPEGDATIDLTEATIEAAGNLTPGSEDEAATAEDAPAQTGEDEE